MVLWASLVQSATPWISQRAQMLIPGRYLLAEEAFEKIDIYEQRDRVGGVWNLSPADRSRNISIPQTNPSYGHRPDTVDAERDPNHSGESLEFESPLYDYLETNIPKGLMAFCDKPFPDDAPLFPPHRVVLQYLEEYATEVRHLIHFSCQVRDVSLDESTESWTLAIDDLATGSISHHVYDAVLVANGHYTVPYVPAILGISNWNKTYPESIIHSKAYRRPEQFKDKKVIVVGNSASGVDIAAQVGQYSKPPLLLSARSVSAFGTARPASWREDVDELAEFLPSTSGERAVRFQSGRIEQDVDVVIFATGYLYSFPFLSNIRPPIVTDGFRTRDVYQHLFHIEHPTLAFPVINLKVVPFPLAQNQAAVIARVWSGRLALPSKAEMREWESRTIKEKGDGKSFHLKKFPEDAAQINELYTWAASARKKDGLPNGGQGKLGSHWDERHVWLRSRFPDIKAAYAGLRPDRFQVTTIEQLGFDYDQWRRRAEPAELEMFRLAKC